MYFLFILCISTVLQVDVVFSFDFSDSTMRAYGLLPPKPVPSQPIKPTGPLDTPPKSTPISDQAESKVEKSPEQQQSTHDVLPSSSEMSSGSPLVSSLPSTSSSTVNTIANSSSMHLPSAILRSSTPAPSPLRKSYTPELSPPSPHTPISTLNLSETKSEDAATTLTTGSTSSRKSPEGSPETSGVPLVVDNNPSVSMTNSPLTSSSLLPQSSLARSPLPSTPHEFSEPPTSTQSSPDLSTMSSLPHHVSPVVTQGSLTPPPYQDVTTPISDFATTAFSAESSQITTNTSTFASLSSSVDEESEQNEQQLISPLLSSSQDVRLLSSSPQVSPQISRTSPSRIYSSTSSPQSNTADIPFTGTIADVTSAMDSLQLSLLRSHKKVDDHSDITSHIEASHVEESQADTLEKEKEKKEEEENTEEGFSDSKDILPDTSSTDLRSTKSSDAIEKEVEKDSPQSPPKYSSSSYKTPTRSSLMVPHNTATIGFEATTITLDDERTQAGLVLAQSLLEEKENLGLGFQNITSFARENAGGSRVISTPRGTQYMISVNKLERNLHDEERRLLEKEKEEESEYDSESDDGCCCGCCCC